MSYSVKFDQSCHWYACRDCEAKPQHDATLREARKNLLYPSITTILKDEFKNEFLDRWKTNELLLAAASTYKQLHESNEQYCQRIYDLSLSKAKTAAEFGKKIHKEIERYPSTQVDPEAAPWIDSFGQWYQANVDHPLYREKILFDPEVGIAGCCDFIGRGKGPFEGQVILPDWKTQDVKRDSKTGKKKPAFYDSWPRQLAFYAVAYTKEAGLFPQGMPTCISYIIDSNEPQGYVRVWTKEEILSAYEDVLIAAYRWFKKRQYYPHPQGMFKLTPSVRLPTL